MAFLSGLSGALGMNNQYQAQSAPLLYPVTGQQVAAGGQQAQAGVANQNALLAQLQAQNGLQNQSNVYNQLQGVANGTGPNPAQAQLAQATGTNVANQAALMAGQRGAGSNVGLIARQQAQQGAQTQQQAAGQAATLQAQQSLNALGQMGGLANTQASNLLGQTNTAAQSAQNLYGQQLGSVASSNQAALTNQQNMNQINAAIAQGNVNTNNQLLQGLGQTAATGTGYIGSQLGSSSGTGSGGTNSSGGTLSAGTQAGYGALTNQINPNGDPNDPSTWARGGMIGYANGGQVSNGPKSYVTHHMKMAKGGQVPVLLSPGEKYVPPAKVKSVAKGSESALKASPTVPGKAKVQGDSEKNDTYKTTLEQGGVVIPRSKMKDEKTAMAFVRSVLAKKGL